MSILYSHSVDRTLELQFETGIISIVFLKHNVTNKQQ